MFKTFTQSLSLSKAQCGKVFEFLFALELCNSADCKLWTFLSSHVNLQPIPTWNPTLKQMNTLDDCIDRNGVYVQVDPDLHTSKVDVVFFALEVSTGNVVRVLVQLTTSPCTVKKATESFNSMLSKASSLQNDLDYRLLIVPKSTATFRSNDTDFFRDNYSQNRCFVFLRDSFILHPSFAKESIDILVHMALKLGE
jgi:hypothetical protein